MTTRSSRHQNKVAETPTVEDLLGERKHCVRYVAALEEGLRSLDAASAALTNEEEGDTRQSGLVLEALLAQREPTLSFVLGVLGVQKVPPVLDEKEFERGNLSYMDLEEKQEQPQTEKPPPQEGKNDMPSKYKELAPLDEDSSSAAPSTLGPEGSPDGEKGRIGLKKPVKSDVVEDVKSNSLKGNEPSASDLEDRAKPRRQLRGLRGKAIKTIEVQASSSEDADEDYENEEDEKAATTTSGGRGRGRPPGSAKGRGRPRGRGRPKIVKKDSHKRKETDETQVELKRKRGRPPKVREEEESKMESSAAGENEPSHSAEFQTPRKRGRPPKSRSSVERPVKESPSTIRISARRRELSEGNDTTERFVGMDTSDFMKQCLDIWREVADHKYAIPFRKPVRPADAPDYYSIIKKPMDLTTLKKQLDDRVISTPVEFRRDLLLICNNAIHYNPRGSDIEYIARQLKVIIQNKTSNLVEAWRSRRPSQDERSLRRGRSSSTGNEDDLDRLNQESGVNDNIGNTKPTKVMIRRRHRQS